MRKLKANEIKTYREELLTKQGSICPLCEKPIATTEAALDHCHRTGKIRRVLHKWCNSVLGRVENWSYRSGIDGPTFLDACYWYMVTEYPDVMHPTHGNRKRRKRATKRKPLKRKKR